MDGHFVHVWSHFPVFFSISRHESHDKLVKSCKTSKAIRMVLPLVDTGTLADSKKKIPLKILQHCFIKKKEKKKVTKNMELSKKIKQQSAFKTCY